MAEIIITVRKIEEINSKSFFHFKTEPESVAQEVAK